MDETTKQDNEMPLLSSETLQALEQFYAEQEARSSGDADAGNQSTQQSTAELFDKDMNASFPEDWVRQRFSFRFNCFSKLWFYALILAIESILVRWRHF